MAVLALDAELAGRPLAEGLAARGIAVRAVAGRTDAEVLDALEGAVLVTLHPPAAAPGRRAVAVVAPPPDLSGLAAEQAAVDIVHRHAHAMLRQRPGEHRVYGRRGARRLPADSRPV